MLPLRTFILATLWYVTAVAGGCANLRPASAGETVEIAGERYTLEIAADDSSRTTGLMGREEISPEGGMLFIFRTAQVRQFWMGYCLINIDLIFLDPQGRVTATHRMKVEAPRRSDESEADYQGRLGGYGSIYPAQFAIELREGTLDRLDIQVDDRIELDLARLKALAR